MDHKGQLDLLVKLDLLDYKDLNEMTEQLVQMEHKVFKVKLEHKVFKVKLDHKVNQELKDQKDLPVLMEHKVKLDLLDLLDYKDLQVPMVV